MRKSNSKGFLNERGRVVIQVTDNGPGLLPEVQEKIFIPFFTTKKEGSGIGLSLCRQIMRLHRGTIYCAVNPKGKNGFYLKILISYLRIVFIKNSILNTGKNN